MKAKNINKIIFDTITTITNTDEFEFAVDIDDDIVQFIYRDLIVIDIRYAKEIATWDANLSIKYPQSIRITQNYSVIRDKKDIVYYNSWGSINTDESNKDKLVITFGDGRTEEYRKAMEFYSFTVPDFVKDIIHHWMPKSIIYRNYKSRDDYCSKSIYFYNRILNVIEGRTTHKQDGSISIPVTTEKTFQFHHNSGITYSMNRMMYTVEEFSAGPTDVNFVVSFPSKILSYMMYKNPYSVVKNDPYNKNNEYLFTSVGDGVYNCTEHYSERKGQPVERCYTITVDTDDIISSIKYYDEGHLSKVVATREITRRGDKVKVGAIKVVEDERYIELVCDKDIEES